MTPSRRVKGKLPYSTTPKDVAGLGAAVRRALQTNAREQAVWGLVEAEGSAPVPPLAPLPCRCLLVLVDPQEALLHRLGPAGLAACRRAVCDVVVEAFRAVHARCTYAIEYNRLVLLVDEVSASRRPEMFASALKRAVYKAERQHGVCITIVMGKPVRDLRDFATAYVSAMEALRQGMWVGSRRVILPREGEPMACPYPRGEEALLLQAVRVHDPRGLTSSAEMFFAALEGACQGDVQRALQRLLTSLDMTLQAEGCVFYEVFEALPEVIDPACVATRFSESGELLQWLFNLISFAFAHYSAHAGEAMHGAIVHARQYIEENYADPNMSLSGIAEYVGLYPAYFSRLFKKETSMNYIDYLSEVRIRHAKELLAETNDKISDIGKQVGYINHQYFCVFFKKSVGMSPMAYRKTRLQRPMGP